MVSTMGFCVAQTQLQQDASDDSMHRAEQSRAAQSRAAQPGPEDGGPHRKLTEGRPEGKDLAAWKAMVVGQPYPTRPSVI